MNNLFTAQSQVRRNLLNQRQIISIRLKLLKIVQMQGGSLFKIALLLKVSQVEQTAQCLWKGKTSLQKVVKVQILSQESTLEVLLTMRDKYNAQSLGQSVGSCQINAPKIWISTTKKFTVRIGQSSTKTTTLENNWSMVIINLTSRILYSIKRINLSKKLIIIKSLENSRSMKSKGL